MCYCQRARMSAKHILKECSAIDYPRMKFCESLQILQPEISDFFKNPLEFRMFIEESLPLLDREFALRKQVIEL